MKQVNIIPFQSHLYLFACICIYNCILYSIFPVSSHSAIVIAGDNTIKEITIFQREKEINIQTKQIPVVDYKVGGLSQNARYCFDPSSKLLYYISNRDDLSSIHISSLSVNQSSFEVSSIQFTEQFGLIYVGKDHHSITIGNETITIQVFLYCFINV